MADTVTRRKKSNNKTKAKFSKQTYLDWYEVMLRVRYFEQAALKAYSQQKIRGFCHVYIGQEAIAGGLYSALRPEDKVVTAYRQHGVALAKGLTSRECMAELFGKETGAVKGKGGSMHFFSKEKNYFGGNGIVGAQIPIGTGIGFAEKYRGTDNVVVCMFGDGAARQGALYESFNMAMSWDIPVLYICENNGYAMGTSVSRTSNVTSIHQIGDAFNMPNEPVDGMNPENVHTALEKALKYIRSGKGPYFLEINTYRYRGHSVSDPAKYRTKEELEYYKSLDPINTIEDKILKNKTATTKEVEAIKTKINDEIKDAVEFAEASAFPPGSDLYTDNYVQEDYPFIRD